MPGRTGLLVFNDASFFFFAGGDGWNNPELQFPALWQITDLDPFDPNFLPGGGYTDILPSFEAHPLYALLSDVRFGVGSISSFGGNVTDGSFHTVFGSYNAGIFTPTEVIVNAGDANPGDFPEPGELDSPDPQHEGRVITLVRAADLDPATACNDGDDNDGDLAIDGDDPECQDPTDLSETFDCADGLDNDGDGRIDFPDDAGCRAADDASERPDCGDGLDNDGDGHVDFPEDKGCNDSRSVSEEVECSDGFDNDGDGDVDAAEDVGCRDALWRHEAPACNDGLDNDGDGRRDFDGGVASDVGGPITDPDAECVDLPWKDNEAPRCGLGPELAVVLLGLRRRFLRFHLGKSW